jgi:hypothetical protein
MKKFWKIILILALIGLVMGGVGYMYTFHKPQRNVAVEKAVAKIEAKAFMAAFEANEADANAKYLDKAVEVTGIIGEITANENTYTINLKVEGVDFGGIKCTIDPAEAKKAEGLNPGETLTIKGQCTGWVNDSDLGMKEVSMTRCFIE